MSNLWILTEEKPKISVIEQIIEAFCELQNLAFQYDAGLIDIVPEFENSLFLFRYKVTGFSLFTSSSQKVVENIYIKTVSGNSSFMDFLVYFQEFEPNPQDITQQPIMAIEETKTNDSESRNTGVYQRGAKFVYIKLFYPNTPLFMLYTGENRQKFVKRPSNTNIFGTNILLTLGVKILGLQPHLHCYFQKFHQIQQLIDFKAKMRKAPKGNVPITILPSPDNQTIQISGRLSKPASSGNIGHDPNIGALSMIAQTIRQLGWDKEIEITHHGVTQKYVSANPTNKFMQICQYLHLKMHDIALPRNISLPSAYWHYETTSEKVADILIHIQCERCGMLEVYQNHAGCERGYFRTLTGNLLTIPKRDEQTSEVISIPDLILCDLKRKEILVIEGKQLSTLSEGIAEYQSYGIIEQKFIRVHYPGFAIHRGISIFGGELNCLPDDRVWFYLTNSGKVFVNRSAPVGLREAFAFA